MVTRTQIDGLTQIELDHKSQTKAPVLPGLFCVREKVQKKMIKVRKTV